MYNWFLERYTDSLFLEKKKARLLLSINIYLLIPFAVLPPLFLYIDVTRALIALSIVSVATFGIIISLMFLKFGKLQIGANVLTAFIGFTIASGTLHDSILDPKLAIVSTALYIPVLILISVLFCSIKWMINITVLTFLSIALIMFFQLEYVLTGAELNIARSGFLNIFGVSAVSTALSIIIVRSLSEHLNVAKVEIEKNKELTKELENKVSSRTEDLQLAMTELKTINKELVQTRDALWGEMELAQKIQTILLPTNPHIRGYNISAAMNTADEVGGDYYDIINLEDKDWVVIGDVSGHGISAGLIMMMVQTSIQSILNHNQNLSPSELLNIINKTLVNNLKKFHDDKYMTITVLACISDGEFHFSGLHQDILIYRKKTSQVDIIETHGMWIGIVDDIEGKVWDESFKLNIGDTILLFTDGITEATDSYGDLFTGKKLVSTFENLGDLNAQEIRDGILNDLKGYKKSDDVTLVIIKRLV